jgi:excisionase family DNA binding protein
MTARKRRPNLTKDELQRPFVDAEGHDHRPIVTPAQLATLCGVSVKTIYQWIASGHLEGTFRKRGKHVLIWRDRALDTLFNGPDWNDK